MSHHQIEKPIAVVQIEISTAVAISFAHSQYDTNFSSSRPPPAALHHSIVSACATIG
jgi:hypothetical protein